MRVERLEVLGHDVLLSLALFDVILLVHRVLQQIAVCDVVQNCVAQDLQLLVVSVELVRLLEGFVGQSLQKHVLVAKTVIEDLFHARTEGVQKQLSQGGCVFHFEVGAGFELLEL